VPTSVPPLVLLHGALGARDQLAPLHAALGALAGQPVHAIELAGHGGTPATAPDTDGFRIERFADQLGDELDRLGASAAVLFGYSMGGYVALHLAASRPERVAAVITLGTKLAWSPEVAAREVARLDPAVLRAKVPRFADALAARHAGAGGWEAVLARTAALLTTLGARPLLTTDVLATIACPVRVLVGDRDATLPVAECVDAVRALPRGELAVLPGTPHPLEQVDAQRLAREIVEVAGRAAAGETVSRR
jgi:pimeloyl-ACP methyl ester carboxylesterase